MSDNRSAAISDLLRAGCSAKKIANLRLARPLVSDITGLVLFTSIPETALSQLERGILAGGIGPTLFYVTIGRNGSVESQPFMPGESLEIPGTPIFLYGREQTALRLDSRTELQLQQLS